MRFNKVGGHGVQISLTRRDLFHAHCFFTPKERGVGLLFHAKEYPRECEAFPYNLGYCQRGSPLEYSEREMNFRNLLYFQVRQHSCTCFLMASPGELSIDYTGFMKVAAHHACQRNGPNAARMRR